MKSRDEIENDLIDAVVAAARDLPPWLFRQHEAVMHPLDAALGRLDDFHVEEEIERIEADLCTPGTVPAPAARPTCARRAQS